MPELFLRVFFSDWRGESIYRDVEIGTKPEAKALATEWRDQGFMPTLDDEYLVPYHCIGGFVVMTKAEIDGKP